MFLDTSIIIEIFRNEKQTKTFQDIYKYIKEEPLFISLVQIGELSDWCLKNQIDPEKRINKLKQILNVIPLNEKICYDAAQIKYTMRKKGVEKFGLLDAIILASARSINQKLLTMDNDFRTLHDAIVLRLRKKRFTS
ncbi:MAG: PIN domain-containing protein [Euryarchaeota archaeon]|nr:PIN domain-containing protein [Euryarchaeota archaeon]